MKFKRHISTQLAARLDGQLTAVELREAEEHLRTCAPCRQKSEQVRSGMTFIKRLEAVAAPDEIWSSIEAGLQPVPKRLRWQWLLAPAVVLILAGIVWWRSASSWIETSSTSRTTINIGSIGTVEVEPNTRVRVVKDRPDEHRLTLARGEIRATISAPPKLFFVDTPSGTAVDLGCAYSLTTEEDGADLLRVTRGWVSFQWRGLESLVPAGASCRTRPKNGPGIPYFDDAPDALKRALETNGNLTIILAESRKRDTLTLWHLLSRVDAGDRARVFDRITALTPLPAGVTREKALQLDRQTLDHWREELAWTW